MSDESRRVLDLLAQGKITVSEAEQLLKAISGNPSTSSSTSSSSSSTEGSSPRNPKYLCIHVEPMENHGRHKGPVNIRLPLDFLRSGVKLAGIMPEVVQGRVAEKLREKGIDLTKMKPDQIDDIIATLQTLHLDVDSERSKVRIFCE